MAKTITELADIGRPVITGDKFVVETDAGTRQVDADKVAGKGALKPPHFFQAAGGETEITVPDLENSIWSLALLSGVPLEPYYGPLPVPPGAFKPDYPQSRIILGNPMYADERIVILHY